MDDETTLRTAAEATMAARRDALGEAPSPEELLAFRDGTLPPEGRGLVEEKVAAFPEAAAALLDLARFPDVPAAPGVREVGDEEIAEDWQRLRARMTRERLAEEAAPAAGRPRWRSAALLAAGLFVGVIGGVLVARGPLAPPPAPAAGADLVALTPDGSADVERSDGAAVAVDPGAPLVLALAAGGVEPRPAYALAVLDHGGRPVWADPAVAPTAAGLVIVELPAGYLAPGRYRVALSAPEGGAPLATFSFSAAEPEGP